MNKMKSDYIKVYAGEIVTCFNPGGNLFKTYDFIRWSPAAVNDFWGVVTNIFSEGEPGDGR